METKNKVTALKFNCDGSFLLVVQGMGHVELFEKGSGMDKWSSVHKCDWDGEDILHIDFFHGGIRVSVSTLIVFELWCSVVHILKYLKS